VARTGRLVTCAALILAISFASLSTAPDIVVEMIATTLAFGVLIDAVVVRTLLVPSRRDHGPLELVDAQWLRAPTPTPTTHDSDERPGTCGPVPVKSLTRGRDRTTATTRMRGPAPIGRATCSS